MLHALVGYFISKFYGPHICGDALDIDSERGQVLTGSWRVDNTLQVLLNYVNNSKLMLS